MSAIRPTPRDRISAATITAALTLALGYALLAGLSVRLRPEVSDPLAVFTVLPTPPPPIDQPAPKPATAPKREGAAAPPNLKAQATEVVAPPIVPIVVPPLITVAPQPGIGTAASAGNADVRGPGPGSGGLGNGTGSGGAGNGDGGGGGTPPHQIGGSLSKADYPRDLFAAGVQGTVSVLFVVSPSGRVTDCEITRSSGNDQLDDRTCDLIISRFRYAPARDVSGRPIESMVEENHSWIIK